MANEMFTQLPSVTNALMTDIICAVQANTSVQETLGQIYTLFQQNVVLNYPGNPNGNVAGVAFQFCWDTTDKILYVCTTPGNASTAVWTISLYNGATNGQFPIGSTGTIPVLGTLTAGAGISIANGAGTITISGTASGLGWTNVTAASAQMTADSGWVSDRSSLVTLTLPVTAALGTAIAVAGNGSGGWSIAQNAGQNIQIGSASSTAGTGGSISSTNQFDSIYLVCIVANTTWSALGGVQGNLTIV